MFLFFELPELLVMSFWFYVLPFLLWTLLTLKNNEFAHKNEFGVMIFDSYNDYLRFNFAQKFKAAYAIFLCALLIFSNPTLIIIEKIFGSKFYIICSNIVMWSIIAHIFIVYKKHKRETTTIQDSKVESRLRYEHRLKKPSEIEAIIEEYRSTKKQAK